MLKNTKKTTLKKGFWHLMSICRYNPKYFVKTWSFYQTTVFFLYFTSIQASSRL